MNGRHRTNAGFSLVELLIAMVLGLLVIGAAGTMFISAGRSAESNLTLAGLQSASRLALEEISTGIRSAGYIGCAGAVDAAPALPPERMASAVRGAPRVSIQGYVVQPVDWAPATPAGYVAPVSGPGIPVPGLDAIVVEGGVMQGIALARSITDRSLIDIVAPHLALEPGAMALISNCARAEAFHIRAVDAVADGARVRSEAPLLDYYEHDADLPFAVRVIPYRRALFYIGDTGRVNDRGEPLRALYEHLFPYAGMAPVEIAQGVEVLVVRYRQRDVDGRVVELGADDADFDPRRVVGVRVGLLASAGTHGDELVASYEVAGQTVRAGVTDGPGFPNDPRVRRVVEKTSMLRNRDERRVP